MRQETDIADFFARETIDCTGSAAVPFTEATFHPADKLSAFRADCTVVGGVIRYSRTPGITATSAIGQQVADGGRFQVFGRAALKAFNAIKISGTPKIDVEYA